MLSLLIAARGGVVPVDRIADELWRGAPPAKAMASLHAYVSNLRRALGWWPGPVFAEHADVARGSTATS
ncbi:winged helix-turn-helix domain-containing protein [Streptomyces adustus]|uniref:AfsR/SARP family transcriptional regulator n=1 Tax=Streptomyces adustus TaxID=1609272 RepID=UPI0035E33A32